MDGTTTMQGTGQDVQTAAAETQVPPEAEATPEKMNALQKFLSGLLGGSKEGDAEEPEKKNEGAADEEAAEKTFTQADMDAAIEAAKQQWVDEAAEAERVKKLTPEEKAKEEQQKKDSEIANLRSQLLQKELRENAVKALEKDGFPVGLADVLDYSSKERMEETLKNTTGIFKENLAAAIKTRLKGKTPEGLGVAASSESLLREQIAKNIRGE